MIKIIAYIGCKVLVCVCVCVCGEDGWGDLYGISLKTFCISAFLNTHALNGKSNAYGQCGVLSIVLLALGTPSPNTPFIAAFPLHSTALFSSSIYV